MRGVLLRVQGFLRDPVFTQLNFISKLGVTLLSEAAATSHSTTSSSMYAPWSEVESELSRQVIRCLKKCFDTALDRRRIVKDTSEQWHDLGVVRPSSVKSSLQYGVRNSTAVEEGQVEHMPVVAPSHKIGGPSRHHSSPGKGKKKVSQIPVKLPR